MYWLTPVPLPPSFFLIPTMRLFRKDLLRCTSVILELDSGTHKGELCRLNPVVKDMCMSGWLLRTKVSQFQLDVMQSCADEGHATDNKDYAPEDCGKYRWTCIRTCVCAPGTQIKKNKNQSECLNVSLVCVYLIIIFCVSSTRVCFCRSPAGEIILNCSLAATHFSYLCHHKDKLPNDAGINSLPGIELASSAESQRRAKHGAGRQFHITGMQNWSKNTSSVLWWGFFFYMRFNPSNAEERAIPQ